MIAIPFHSQDAVLKKWPHYNHMASIITHEYNWAR